MGETLLAAIFEHDQAIATLRVFEAEQALVARAHELFHAGGDNIEEQEDLDDAMYVLQALPETLQRTGLENRAGRGPLK